MSVSCGIWTAYDELGPGAPQSWNRYAYVGGTPLEAVDPLGLCPTGTHDATTAEMAVAIAVAESYVGKAGYSSGAHWQTDPARIDCSGLMMCALAGASFGSPFPGSYLGMNLTTRNIDQWTDPGTGAVGDIIYFPRPGHVGIVTSSDTFIGSQTSTGPAGNVLFGADAPYWGNPADTSAPVFRRACVADTPAAATSSHGSAGSGGGSQGGGGGAGVSGGSGGGPLGFLGLGGLTGNWAGMIGAYLQALMPTVPTGTITTTSTPQCTMIAGKRACF